MRGRALRRFAGAAVAATVVGLTLAPAGAQAARPLDVGFADYLYESAQSKLWVERTAAINADVIRVNMPWSLVAFHKPANPRDPADPNYNWNGYDEAIRNAVEHGFDVDLTVMWAPAWAEGPNRPSREQAPAGSWRPDANAFGDFAHAVAKRYSGTYEVDGRLLPRVEYFEAWNEPNLGTYITPQFQGRRNVSADIYVKLLNRFYDGVKAESPGSKVVSGGTAPYGDKPGAKARKTSPLQFARELMCLSPKLRRTGCPGGERPKFDVYAHHPINRAAPPTAHGPRDDDLMIADFADLTRTVRKAEKLNTIGTSGRHGLWANEVWWQTNPPDKGEGVSLLTQARWMQQALYLLWKQGASNVSFLQLRDAKYKPGEYTLDTYQTGVYFFNDKPKPSARAMAFPFVTDRRSKSTLFAWGKAPRTGKLTITAKRDGRGGHRKVRTLNVTEGRVFTTRLRIRGDAELRARVGKSKSLVWSQRG